MTVVKSPLTIGVLTDLIKVSEMLAPKKFDEPSVLYPQVLTARGARVALAEVGSNVPRLFIFVLLSGRI